MSCCSLQFLHLHIDCCTDNKLQRWHQCRVTLLCSVLINILGDTGVILLTQCIKHNVGTSNKHTQYRYYHTETKLPAFALNPSLYYNPAHHVLSYSRCQGGVDLPSQFRRLWGKANCLQQWINVNVESLNIYITSYGIYNLQYKLQHTISGYLFLVPCILPSLTNISREGKFAWVSACIPYCLNVQTKSHSNYIAAFT